MTTILIIVGILFLIPVLVVLIILGIYRYVSYNRAKRLFDAYRTRSFKKK